MSELPELPEGFEDLPPPEQVRMARDKARKMLEHLEESKREAEQRARSEDRIGEAGYLTGRHAMDQAIASTRRMLEALEALAQDMAGEEE